MHHRYCIHHKNLSHFHFSVFLGKIYIHAVILNFLLAKSTPEPKLVILSNNYCCQNQMKCVSMSSELPVYSYTIKIN